jgi:hypothetical protein
MDKTFRIYDISSLVCVKTIQAHGQIHKMIVDPFEANLYAACENQNVYHYSLEGSSSNQE